MDRRARDLAAVARACCNKRPFHLVGHDWGSIQSWEAVTGSTLKGRIASFTSISGPCLDHAVYSLREDARASWWRATGRMLRQLRQSWYIVFFHLPVVPALMWRAGGARLWPRHSGSG